MDPHINLNPVITQQEVISQRQELSRFLQHQNVGGEECQVMKKELVELRHTLSDTTKRLQVHTHTHRVMNHHNHRCIHTYTHTDSLFPSVCLSQECDDGWMRRLEEQQEQSRKQEEINNTRLKVPNHLSWPCKQGIPDICLP